MESRRDFLRKMIVAGGVLLLRPEAWGREVSSHRKCTEAPCCKLYRAVNGSPAQNLIKVVELMGGIEKLVSQDDLVLLKPNVQWWNQGAPNLAALKAFVDLIMERPGGFKGEVVLAENCHRGSAPWQHGGWAHGFERNSDLSHLQHMNDLVFGLKKEYGEEFSACHWIDVDAGGGASLARLMEMAMCTAMDQVGCP